MSVDYCIYVGDSRAIALDELRSPIIELGWHLVVIRNYFDPDTFQEVRTGVLRDDDYFLGWRLIDPLAGEYEKALLTKYSYAIDLCAIPSMREGGEASGIWSIATPTLGAGSLSINRLDPEDLDPDELTEFAQVVSPEYADAIRRAKLEFVIEPHSDSSEFLDLLARQFCLSRGGAWTDNCGVCEVSERGGPVRRFECDL